MMGKRSVGAMTARACHRYDPDVASRGLICLTLVMGLSSACSDAGSSAVATSTSAPPDVAVGPDTTVPTVATVATVTTVTTVTTAPTTIAPEPTGVPGLGATDPFCAAWAAYAGTRQARGVAGAFGALTVDQLAVLELRAAPRLVEAAA